MAEEVTTAPPVDVSAPTAATGSIQHDIANGEAAEVPKEDEEIVAKPVITEATPPDAEGTTEVTEPPPAPTGEDETTPSGGKKEKRKSVGGVPEHKNKKLNKKKSMPTLHLDCKPGDMYWARLKGYPPWPAVICDEQMLPESLLASRPVSTTRPDGSLRDDFKEGGKNAKERTFPVMFLSTNEFQWMVNTSLTPLDPEDCKTATNAKMSKALKDAYRIASENHDLEYFKGILRQWQQEEAQFEQERREEEERRAAEAERKAQEAAERAKNAAENEGKPKKKKSRKSKDGDGDVNMEDADTPKSSKKRKNEGDADGAKPKKTPKVTKLNAPKTPNGDEASDKKSSTKSKKKIVTAPKEDEDGDRPVMTEAEMLLQREKAVLYLRHRLQKGFLSRDQAPVESEMAAMADFFSQLEAYENLEPSIIRATKVHKVLKAIVKLSSIPKEEVYDFKKRSAAMLEIWNKRMEAETESAPPSAVEAPKASEEPVAETKETVEESSAVEKEVEAAAIAEPVAAEATATAPSLTLAEPAPSAPAEPIVPVVEETKIETEVKDDAVKTPEEVVTEQKAEEAADKLDEKVETIVAEKTDVVTEPPSAPVETTELGNDAKDEATDANVTT